MSGMFVSRAQLSHHRWSSRPRYAPMLIKTNYVSYFLYTPRGLKYVLHISGLPQMTSYFPFVLLFRTTRIQEPINPLPLYQTWIPRTVGNLEEEMGKQTFRYCKGASFLSLISHWISVILPTSWNFLPVELISTPYKFNLDINPSGVKFSQRER